MLLSGVPGKGVDERLAVSASRALYAAARSSLATLRFHQSAAFASVRMNSLPNESTFTSGYRSISPYELVVKLAATPWCAAIRRIWARPGTIRMPCFDLLEVINQGLELSHVRALAVGAPGAQSPRTHRLLERTNVPAFWPVFGRRAEHNACVIELEGRDEAREVIRERRDVVRVGEYHKP